MSEVLLDQFQGMSALVDIDKILDTKAQAQGMHFTTMDPSLRIKGAVSTGIYCFDLMSGGGYAGGRFVYFYGPTGSCKSTAMYHGVKSFLERNIRTNFFDHEASVDPTYFKNIGVDLDLVCGRRNKKGEWVVPPKFRYALGITAESTFKFMNQAMHQLPDKIQLFDPKEDVYRYFLIAPEHDYKLTWKSINDGLKVKKVVEVADFSPQMVFIADSIKAMLPDAKNDDIDSEPMALLARTLGANIPLVKSLLGTKHCMFLATNHLTINPMQKFGCFQADTVIPFVDGRSYTIREVVENKIEGEVWSYDESSQHIVPRKIIDWHFNGEVEKPNDFLTVTCEAVDTANGVASFTSTLNHEVLTSGGWKQAKELKPGDALVTKYQSKINGSLHSFLLGTIVGNCTFTAKNNGVCSLKFQDKANPDYVQWKLSKLSEHFSFRPVRGRLPYYISETRHEFTVLKRTLGKRNPLPFMDKMDDLSLALWFMDDGNGDFSNDHCHGSLSVGRFRGNMQQIGLLQEGFQRKGLECSVRYDKGCVWFNKESFLLLCSRIHTFIPPCMQYKLPPEFRGHYQDFDLECSPTIEKEYVRVLSITEGSDRKFRQKGKYDISVEDTHTYMVGNMANGVVVHNSPEAEPGGTAVQFYPDQKFKMFMSQYQSKIIIEPHVSGDGEDRYCIGRSTILKNKAGPSFRSMPFRLWKDEQGRPGRGIDPVFDMHQFLKSCGLIEKVDKETFGIKLKGWEGKSFSWLNFKKLVLLEQDGKQLRREIESMLADGSAFDLYYDQLSRGGGEDEDDKKEDKPKKGKKKAEVVDVEEVSEEPEVEV